MCFAQVGLGINSRLLQQHISRTTGKLLTVKDIHNLKASINRRDTDMASVLREHAAQCPNDDIRLVVMTTEL